MNERINSQALLASLKVSQWSARRFDKAVTRKVNDSYAASRDAGRYNKHLLPGTADSYKAVVKAGNALRTFHYANTLAWSDEGARLLPVANFQTYSDGLRQLIGDFDSAAADFAADYPRLKADAQYRLNGMYRDEDYPPAHTIRSRFTAEVTYSPIPAGSDFRLSLPEDEIRAIALATETRVQSAVADAMKDAWARLHDVVSHIQERLSTPGAIFRDSLITNARELTDVLSRLNLTNDPDLETARAEVAAQLATVDPQLLRDNVQLRDEKAREADMILARIQGIMGPR